MNLMTDLRADVAAALQARLGADVDLAPLALQTTREEFEGEYTLVVFPWIKLARTKPEVLAEELGKWLVEHSDRVVGYNVVKGFLRLTKPQTGGVLLRLGGA